MQADLHGEAAERLLAATQDTHNNDDDTERLSPLQPVTSEEGQLSDYEHSQVCRLLYVSHFLSTWNSRFFEFGAFLFLANIYPQTLLPASVYALARAASAALLSPWLGFYIDRSNRLQVVRHAIVGQRSAVALSCALLFLMTQFDVLRVDQRWSTAFLIVLSILACIEKLSSVLNTISIERDWVVIVASNHEDRLRRLNSQMRRIDLFCKLVGPFTIAMVDGVSSRVAIMVTGSMTAASVSIEYFAIAKVYKTVPNLRVRNATSNDNPTHSKTILATLTQRLSGTAVYFRHQAFLPSFSLALLYLTVLSFAGQMITYLVALGLSSGLIGALRAVSALFELSATVIAPRVMKQIGPVRAGIWFLNWQIACVGIACLFFWLHTSPTIAAFGTVIAVMVSRIGLWGFDLSAQIIVQEEVEPELRGTFSSREFALQNIFEMFAVTSTIVFPRPAQFRYPATVSAAGVGCAGVLYAIFVRSRRGHLVHLSQCVNRNGRHKDRHHWWMR